MPAGPNGRTPTLTTVPCTCGEPAVHRLPSGPTTVIAANVVCRSSLNVALTRTGPALTEALSAGSADTRAAWALAAPAVNVSENATAASSSATTTAYARRLTSSARSARDRHRGRRR